MSEWETTSVDLKKRVDAGDDVFILDVREPNEYQICRIPGSVLIPLGELPRRYAELPKDKRHRRALQDGRAQRQSPGIPAVGRVQAGKEPQGRDSRLDRQGRSFPAQVLKPAGFVAGTPVENQVIYDKVLSDLGHPC